MAVSVTRVRIRLVCSDCRWPLHLSVPVAMSMTTDAQVMCEADLNALRAALRVHARQHDD